MVNEKREKYTAKEMQADQMLSESATTADLSYSGSKPFTINVRSSGGDASTISEALSLIPSIPFQDAFGTTVKIDLESGKKYNIDSLYFAFPWVSLIQLEGDSANKPTLAVADSEDGVTVNYGTRVQLADLKIENQANATADYFARARRASWLSLVNCDVTGSINGRQVHALYASHVEVDGDTVLTGPGSGTGDGILMHSSSHLRLDGTVQDLYRAVHCDRGATADIIGATIDNSSYLVFAEDGAEMKVSSGTMSNAGTAAFQAQGGTVQQVNGPTFSGNNKRYELGDYGIYRDRNNNDVYVGVPGDLYYVNGVDDTVIEFNGNGNIQTAGTLTESSNPPDPV